MKTTYLLAGVAVPALGMLATSCGGGEQKTAPTKPNIIVILADDMGFGDLSVNGSKAINTPNLDFLANGGVNFTDGHATSATSTPSRFGMFTGLYPWRVGARILPGDAPLIISTEKYTMPKMMQSAGYTTGAIGKWHLGMGNGKVNWNETVKPGANEIGFDYSCLIAATNDRVPTVYVENGNVVGLEADDPIQVNYKVPFENEPIATEHPEMLKMKYSHGHDAAIVNGIPRIGYMTGGKNALWVDEDMADYFVDKVAEFIDDQKDSEKPFFLYYGLHQPHVPRAPHSRFVGATDLGPRGDAVVEADWCVGELIKKLEKDGLLENTLIIYSSDNGHVLDDGYQDDAAERLGDHDPAGGRRGGKYSLFDGGTRVPFIVYWKGHVLPKVSNALVSQLDIAASLGELIGAEIPAGLDSEAHLDALLGKSDHGREKYIVEANSRLAYRSGKYALIPPYSGPKVNGTGNELGTVDEYSLYDLSVDVNQQNNIFADEKELAESIKAEFLAKVDGFYPPKPTAKKPAAKKK